LFLSEEKQVLAINTIYALFLFCDLTRRTAKDRKKDIQ